MEKGHYGHYTGNARHSRKEEMIHDREMIYDAKTQIHNEDDKYKDSGKDSYKTDMIHERELIHDTKSQLHKADQDYKSDGPKSYEDPITPTSGADLGNVIADSINDAVSNIGDKEDEEDGNKDNN